MEPRKNVGKMRHRTKYSTLSSRETANIFIDTVYYNILLLMDFIEQK